MCSVGLGEVWSCENVVFAVFTDVRGSPEVHICAVVRVVEECVN